MMGLGYTFLYSPILSLIVFSFNAGRQSHSWLGFTTKWYQALFANEAILKAAWLSLKIAFMAANTAVIIGTVGALVMVRFQSFKGKTFFNSLVTAPLVMPDVMSGLALLLLFVMLEQAFGWPQRGMLTITLGHITISIAYVLVIVRTRLAELDQHIEEAALDLGARPVTVFFRITLPMISPSLISGWLLAFTLSLDDVILANFLSGPGSTTLPMLVFSSVRFGLDPQMNALASIIVCLVAIGVVIGGIFIYRRTLSHN
jgi:putrescine transport system permease protein